MNKIVFFDVDNVIIRGQTQKYLLKYLFKKRKISFCLFVQLCIWFLLYKWGIVKDTAKIRKKAFSSFCNWSYQDSKIIFDDFFRSVLEVKIHLKCVNIIKKHILDGDIVVLLSASLSEIVNRIKDYLSVSYAISTYLEVVDGKYTGRILGEVPYGGKKVDKVKEFIKSNNMEKWKTCAYADHISDLSLLNMVDYPIVINGDRELMQIAKDKSWPSYGF